MTALAPPDAAQGIEAAVAVVRIFVGLGAVALALVLASVIYTVRRLAPPPAPAEGFGEPPSDAPSPQSWAALADASDAMLAARMASYEQTPGDC